MRLLIAGIAALAAVSFAAPSFAQEDAIAAPAPAATPTPAVKHKAPTTAAYCNSLKTSSQKNSCLKRVQTAKATKPHTVTATKTKKSATAPAATTSMSDPMPSVSPSAAPSAAPSGTSVAVPPLPQKTI